VDEAPPAVTGNKRAFRVLVRNALFRRVELAARRNWWELGELDEDNGWDAEAWEKALEPYFAEHGEIGTGPDARGPALLILTEGPRQWTARQIFDDPAGDLAASDEAGAAVVVVTSVGQLGQLRE